MTTETAERLLTAEEFMRLPELPGGRQAELVCGRVIELPPQGGLHAMVAREIERMLGNFAAEHALGRTLGEAGFLLRRQPDTVRAPDAAFLAYADFPEGGIGAGAIAAAPTLAVEVLTDGVLDAEIVAKVEEYLRAGSKRVWVVRIPQRTVTVHRPNGDAHTYREGDTLGSDDAAFAVEGFALPVAAIFA